MNFLWGLNNVYVRMEGFPSRELSRLFPAPPLPLGSTHQPVVYLWNLITRDAIMTLEEMQLLIDEGDPLMPEGWNEERELKEREHRERVRLQCVKEYLTNPLHQARAAKDPNYWNNFYVGQYNLFKEQDDSNT